MSRYLQSAFDAICKEAKQPEGCYVCLMERVQRYGGPEEGGWWTEDHVLVAYQWCATEEEASAIRERVEALAAELQGEAHREHGEYCLRSMEWLDARGLDADFLPEPDGPSEFYVAVEQGLPSNTFGPTHYE